MKRECYVLWAMVPTLMWSACGKSPTAPTSPTAVVTPAAAGVSGIAVTGNVSLTTIAETSQLTATAAFTDGTFKDVTSDANTKWISTAPSIISVSPRGLLTVVAFGSAYVEVAYQSTNSGKMVTATPSGTFVISGWVREPGEAGVPGVRATDTVSGEMSQTNQDGNYSIAQLPSRSAHIRFEKDGYEPAELDATPSNAEVAIQRVIRLTVGDTVTPLRLAPHDLSYTIGQDLCYPCRLVRVTAPAGTFHISVTWTELRETLNLWASGQFFAGAAGALTADVPVNAAGEIIMYIGSTLPAGANGLYVPFTITTAPLS